MQDPTAAGTASAVEDDQGLPADMVVDDVGAAAPDPQQEIFARKLGWRPKDEYAKLHPGREERWVDADAFIERTETEAPLLRSQMRKNVSTIEKLEQKLQESERLTREQGEALKELLDRSRGAEARGFEYAVDQVKQRQREAVKDANEAAYDQCERELAELARMRPTGKAPDPKADQREQPGQAVDAATTAWVQSNPWFKLDGELNEYAIKVEGWIMAETPNLSTSERLAKVKERVQKKFPEKFENGARAQPSPTARPTAQGARPQPKKTRTIDDLPAAEREPARQAFAMIQKRTPGFTLEQYIKSYKA